MQPTTVKRGIYNIEVPNLFIFKQSIQTLSCYINRMTYLNVTLTQMNVAQFNPNTRIGGIQSTQYQQNPQLDKDAPVKQI